MYSEYMYAELYFHICISWRLRNTVCENEMKMERQICGLEREIVAESAEKKNIEGVG